MRGKLIKIFAIIFMQGMFLVSLHGEEIKLRDYKVSITDGDTIRAGDYRLRMQHIDAPEIKQKCKTVEGKFWNCGVKSKEYLEKLVLGKDISCKIVGRDKYKRSLSICYDGKVDINQEMVKAGYALAYVKYDSPYINEQKEAMSGLAGIWSGTFIEPEIYRQLKKASKKDMAKEFKEKLDL